MTSPAAPPLEPGPFSLATPPLFAALAAARRILVAGAGGGFDVYAGLPLALALWQRGAQVHLANLSFSELELLDRDSWAAENVAAVVLVDGGTDILLRGDESDLGTPVEDITSVAAVTGLDVAVKLVTCLGFGIDAYHGVNHVQVLENLAALDREGGYLGALSIPGNSREAVLYRDAVADAQAATPRRPSIVNGQIAAATSGAFGDVQFTSRTNGSTLFVNPLMAIYFTVDLDKLAARCLYLDRIEDTYGRRQVISRIAAFRDEVSTRIPRAFPH